MFSFFNDTATSEIYTLSLHDALPIFYVGEDFLPAEDAADLRGCAGTRGAHGVADSNRIELELDAGDHGQVHRADLHRRSEEHTSELQSLTNLVCRLLLEKKNKNKQLC